LVLALSHPVNLQVNKGHPSALQATPAHLPPNNTKTARSAALAKL
jgi:hypothetical protein